MQAHASDLRDEIAHDWDQLTEGSNAPNDEAFDAFVHAAVRDWRSLPVTPSVMAMLEHAERITKSPAACNAEDVEYLRRLGWNDAAIHDAVQVVAYFNYINRIADALGVEPEPEFKNWGAT